MTIRIVTDSACDLSDEELAQWGIGMVPLSIRFGDEEFTDRTQLSTDEFYRRLGASEVLPETAAPSPGAFVEMFNAMQAEGATGVVCINLSEALSATIQAARTAASSDDVTIDVRVVNSKQLTGGLGSIVLAAAAAAKDWRLGRRGRGVGRRHEQSNPRVRRARHLGESQKGRTHRRRTSRVRCHVVDQTAPRPLDR